MATKRFYYETEETHTTKKKGWIEVEMDYTQIYSCFNQIAPKIASATTFKLLFYLLSTKMNDSNGIDTRLSSFKEFNIHLETLCGPNKGITYRTFMNCMKELKGAGALTQVGKGNYYANPLMFWQSDHDSRNEFLTEEAKSITYDEIEDLKVKQLQNLQES